MRALLQGLLSVVVVTWRSSDTFDQLLASLTESRQQSGVAIEVIQVDNDESAPCVHGAAREEVDLRITNGRNVGFAVAANQGVAQASNEWVVILNPDLVLATSFFSDLLSTCSACPPDVGVVSPELRFLEYPDIIQTRGIGVDRVGMPFDIDAGLPIKTPRTVPLFGATGGALAVRREIFLEAGGFSPHYFTYLEDVDLAFRLQCGGVTARYAPGVIALHAVSSSTGQRSRSRAYLVARNRRLLFRRYGKSVPGFRAQRELLDMAHMIVEAGRLRSLAPIRGRIAARDVQRPGVFAPADGVDHLPFAQSISPRAHIRRKRSVTSRSRA